MVAHSSAPTQYVPIALRVAVGGGCALAGLCLFLPPTPIAGWATLLVWLGFALGIGYGFARAWALPLALLPFVGIWYTRATGPEYLGNGDASWLASALLILAGGGAISLGAGLHRWLRATLSRHAPRGALAIALLAPVLILLLLSAALDLGGRRAFVSIPRPIEVRRYSDDDVRAAASGLPFAIYGATTEGPPGGIVRQTIAPPGITPTEAFIVIYCDARCRRASEVQIQSAPPGFHRTSESQPSLGAAKEGMPEKPLPTISFEVTEIAGVSWHVVASGPQPAGVSAIADLAGASVQIHAPDRPTFTRVAAALRPLAPVPQRR